MKKVVFTFGRMNPPTIGHQKLVDKVNAVAKQQRADARIYLSHTQNKKKDPLDYASKIKYATKAFGSVVTKTTAKTIIQVLTELQSAGYTDVTLVVGSDRIPEFKKLLTKYNGKDYQFNSINFISAGQRDPDAEGVSGMSASKMRALAMEGDLATFKSGLPKALQPSAKEIYNKLRNIMEEEDKQLDEAALTLQQRQKRSRLMKRLAKKMQRKKQIAARRMADSKKIQKRALKKARQIVRKKVAGERGEKYATLAAAQKISIDKLVDKKQPLIAKIAKKLLPKVRKAEMERLKKARSSKNEERETLTLNTELNERIDPRKEPNLFRALTAIEREKQRDLQKFDRMRDTARVRDTIYRNRKEEVVDEVAQDKDIKDKEGSQPAKYHSGLKKSTKATRDAQFKKGAEMSHKDPKAYPEKHAGDDTAKTRTSKHTKKYHDMFGEARKCTKEGGEAADFGNPDAMDQERKSGNLGKSVPVPGHYKDKGVKSWKQMPKLKVQDENPPTGVIKAGYEVDGEYEITEESKGALQKKADKSGIPYSILKKVYDRGMAAWRTGHRPGAGQEQWAYARVNSFITKGKGTWGGADKDLAAKVKKEEVQFDEACWDGYKQVGMKKKGDKMVPDCVPEAKNPAQQAAIAIAKKKKYSDMVGGLKETDSVQPAVKKTAYAKHPRTGNTFNPFSPNDAGKTTGKAVAPNQPQHGRRALTMGEEVKELGPEGKAKEIKHKSTKKTMKDILPKSGAGQEGTDELVKTYLAQTPGMTIEESYTGIGTLMTAADLGIEIQGAFAYHPSVEEFVEEYEDWGEIDEAAEYQGKKVKLNNPFRLPSGSKKKFGVYVKNDKGNVVKVTFGDPNMEIKRDDPKRRAAFRSRHSCDDDRGPKWKARYWSCYQWRAGKKVDN
jgi:nicotinic acid mononucleotide adenylyltransferase